MASSIEARDLELGEVCTPFRDSQLREGDLSGEPLRFRGRKIDIHARFDGLKKALVDLRLDVRVLTPDQLREFRRHKINLVSGRDRVEVDFIPKDGLPQVVVPWTVDKIKGAEVVIFPNRQSGS